MGLWGLRVDFGKGLMDQVDWRRPFAGKGQVKACTGVPIMAESIEMIGDRRSNGVNDDNRSERQGVAAR